MAAIIVDHVTKLFSSGVPALADVCLEIEDGEQVVVVGPSGCGKSTLLRVVAGLEELTRGAISIDGRDITHLAPQDRDVAMVFQDYALYPHMTVRRNLAYALRLRRMPAAEIEKRVAWAADLLSLTTYLDRRPGTLSGGQKQRVALGRAIVREPKVFLMDEPLSNLDAKLRAQMRAEITRLHDRLRTTTLFVTHDQAEAMTLADRIVVLKSGEVQQVAAPEVMYEKPQNMFVAGFIGSPTMSFLPAQLATENGRSCLLWRGGKLLLDPARASGAAGGGRDVILGVRPEHFIIGGDPAASSASGGLRATVRVVENMGNEKFLLVEPEAGAGDDIRPEQIAPEDGGTPEGLIVVRDTNASRVQRGEAILLTPDPARIHLFDPQTEQAIT